MNCNEAVSALVASLENGEPMSDGQREHIRTCERCRELLDSAKQFQTLLADSGVESPPIDPVLAAAEEEVRLRRERRAIGICAGIILILGAGVASMLVAAGDAPPGEAVMVVGVAVLIALLLMMPLFLLLHFVRRSKRGKPRFYKRLGPGRYLSGVCLGIADGLHVNVSIVRLVFLLLLFFHGAGFWLYLILDLAMPVHPEDRQHLWRFKVRRWLQRRWSHAKDDVG
jgi:phage shock protein PspC (stress-responsive transcriptional regulator)